MTDPTPTPTGITAAFTAAVAQRLEDAGVGNWNPTGSYVKTDIGIFLRAIPGTANVGDVALALAVYAVEQEADHEVDHGYATLIGFQVRARGSKDPRVVDKLTDDVTAALHGWTRLTWTDAGRTVPIPLIWLASRADLGPDSSGRWETTSNFYARTTRI